jgi:hypothetical protein
VKGKEVQGEEMREKKKKKRHTTTTFRTPMVLDFIINNHPDCIVRIGWETCTSYVTFGELQVSEVRAEREPS